MTQPLYACSTCQTAEQADDHPKVHYGPDRYHYGCLPAAVKADILGDQSEERQQKLAALIAEAEKPKGKRGAALRELVVATNPNGV